MARSKRRDVAVGAVFAIALVVVAVTVMAVGEESMLFTRTTRFQAVFPVTSGLSVGSPVKMSGVQIGTVLGIRLPTDPGELGIEVALGVDPQYSERVREDSRAALVVLQYLTGEKAVSISPGTPGHAPLEPGETIQLEESTELLQQVGVVSNNLAEITVSLKNLLGALERGEGLIGQMIHDPEWGKDGLEALRSSFENFEALTADLRDGKGLAGRLLQDDEFAGHLDDLGRAIQSFAGLMEGIDPQSGALGEMLREDGAGQQMMLDLRDTAATLKKVAGELEDGEGLLGRVLNDPEFSDNVAQDLAAILHNTAEITDKINRGEGALGALVNDPALVESLEDVISGVNDSKFARWLLRHYQKKGIKTQTAAAGGADPEGEP